jgi:hypothetical protein
MPGSNKQAVSVIHRAIIPLSLVALSSLGTVSCKDAVAVPAVDMCPQASVPLCNGDHIAALVTADVDDALSRSVPALENATARDALTVSLSQLDSALAAGNLTRSREALSRSREAFGQSGDGDLADLTAVQLLLDQIAILLGTS